MKILQQNIKPNLLNMGNKPREEDGVVKYSCFFQENKATERPGKEMAKNYELGDPDIHSCILSFLGNDGLKNMRLTSKSVRQFIDKNMINGDVRIKLMDHHYINQFIFYLSTQDNIFLSNLKTLLLEIDADTRIILPETGRFERLINELKKASIKNLHLKFSNIGVNYLKYLANSGLKSLTNLDLSLSEIGTAVKLIVDGNLNLEVLILDYNDIGAKIFRDQKNGINLHLRKEYNKGNIYVGQWKNNKWHGNGTYIDVDGRKYVGQWKDDKWHGNGTYIDADGRKYVGQWKDGHRCGKGTYIWADGSTYVGQWEDDKENGEGAYTSVDGSTYIGQWKDGNRHGYGTETEVNLWTYAGQWKNNKWHGNGTYTGADGSTYVGQWRDGNKHGEGTLTLADGRKYVGQWNDDKCLEEEHILMRMAGNT